MSSTAQHQKSWCELATECGDRTREALAESILPFWWRARDAARGGVFSCWTNSGDRLASRDKFTWSQGRFAWLCARVAESMRQGRLPGDADAWLDHARKTVDFLCARAVLDDGRCAFRLTEDGRPLEAFAGSGLAPSIYADCFVAMGCAEFARVSGDRAPLEQAWQLARSIARHVASDGCPTWPTPIPVGYEAFAPWMILLNVALVLHRASAQWRDERVDEARSLSFAATAQIFERFARASGEVTEFRAHDVKTDGDTLLNRLTNPGHTLEGAWMLLAVAARAKRPDWSDRTAAIVRSAFARGWDEAHGGILYYVDVAGGEPRGTPGDTDYERNVRANWDTKLWWPHSESLVAALSSHLVTGDPAALAWFERAWAYTFATFPNPNRQIGEWIQIRDRRGAPLERVVALPVKDPYHITRNLLQLLEFFSGSTTVPLP